ncbi:hypothetical protein ACHQM5_005885 [Ranunculus cassubicifolius]
MASEDSDKTEHGSLTTRDLSKYPNPGNNNVGSTTVLPAVLENDGIIDALPRAGNNVALATVPPGYPFRYDLSLKAQKQINDIIYCDVAAAVSNLQKLVSGLLKERDCLERRCKELEASSTASATGAETKHREHVESLEVRSALLQKELDDLKKLHAQERNSYDVERQEHEQRLELAMQEMQDATRKALFFRAEAKAKAPLVANAQEHVTDLMHRVEAMKKLLKEHNVDIPSSLLASLTKDHRG